MEEVRLIDANALKQEIRKQIVTPKSKLDVFTIKEVFKTIDNAPTVEQKYYERIIAQINPVIEERPQGEWIEDDNHNIVCPFCGGIRRDCRIDHINFCNRCGAKMRGDT